MNETTQQEKTTQLSSRNETTQLVSRNETTQLNRKKTTQLVSRNETTQLCTAVDRLHRLYSRIGFFYLLSSVVDLTKSVIQFLHKILDPSDLRNNIHNDTSRMMDSPEAMVFTLTMNRYFLFLFNPPSG
ncbi:hypothetical protein TNCV_1405871 [Trichonephila clavipes]|nr:hypothetical protein TNCV_1405871 [Trichonephila clavipes]